MRTLAISIILISMISCLKAPVLQEGSMPTLEVGDKIAAISKQLERGEKPDLAIIKDIIAGKLPGWEKPIEYIAGNRISNSMTLLQIMSYYKYPYEELEPLIEDWIKHGGDNQAKDAQGRGALHLAAMDVNTPIVKLLLDLHIKDTIADSNGKLAIHHACERCEKEGYRENNMYATIKSLLEPFALNSAGSQISTDPSGAGSQVSTEHALDDLLRAAKEKAKQELKAYINKLDNKGNSPLYYTSQAMYRSLKKLDKPDITDNQRTGLQRGYKQAERCYLYLKEHCADANQEKIIGNKFKILMSGKSLVSPEVAKAENYIKNFIEKVEKKELEKIASLTAIIQADTKINDEGHTILYWLIDNKHREVARMLVEEAKEEELRKSLSGSQSSFCPLYEAVKSGDFGLSKLLIYGKAIKKYRGQLVAQVAADSVESEIVEARGGVITRSYADNSKTLLDAACESGNLAVVKLILESMAICSEKYEYGRSLPANEIMGELKYFPNDTHGYAEAIRKFIEQVRSEIEGKRKILNKMAQKTKGRSEGGSVGCFSFSVSAQRGKDMTAPPWEVSREHAVSEARQAWRDKENRIWEQKL